MKKCYFAGTIHQTQDEILWWEWYRQVMREHHYDKIASKWLRFNPNPKTDQDMAKYYLSKPTNLFKHPCDKVIYG